MLGTTVLESSCPFSAPHIVINSPPPQNPWIPWYNAVNDPQDGCYLIVPSPRASYINMDEDVLESRSVISSATSAKFLPASGDDEEDIQADADYEDKDDLEVDQFESPSLLPSRLSSPCPETPTDDAATFLRGFFSVRRPDLIIDEDDVDDWDLALAVAKNALGRHHHHHDSASIFRVSLPVIEEVDIAVEVSSPRLTLMQVPAAFMDEDDGLPPFDGWYLGASRNAQCQPLLSLDIPLECAGDSFLMLLLPLDLCC